MKWNGSLQSKNWGIILGLTAANLIVSLLLAPWFGWTVIFFSIFPVGAAGVLLGLAGGLFSGLFFILANLFLYVYLGHHPWGEMLNQTFFLGPAILLAVGVVTGHLKGAYERQRSIDVQLRSRERHLTLLKDLISSDAASRDYDRMLQSLARDFVDLLEADACYILRWDSLRECFSSDSTTTVPAGMPGFGVESIPDGQTIASRALDAGLPVAAHELNAAPGLHPKLPYGAVLGVPLIFANQKLGVAIVAYRLHRRFSKDELQRAGQVGGQIAMAIWSMQQNEELQKRLHEASTLAAIARNLSETEHVGLRSVLQLIIEAVKDLIPAAEMTVIHLLDEGQQVLLPEAVSGFDQPASGALKMPIGKGVAGQVLAKGEEIYIADVLNDTRYLPSKEGPNYRSLVVAPVQSGSQKLGTVSIQNSSPNAFTEEDCQLLRVLGTQAANACLLEITKKSLNETDALYQITQKLVATVDPDRLMEDVVELLQKNFGYYYVQIFVLDPATGDFVVQVGSGEMGKKVVRAGHRLAQGEGIVGYTAETGMPFFTNNVEDVVFWVCNPLIPETKSELSVPIKSGDHFLGLIDVQQVPPGYLSQRDVQLVSAVADQLAVALQKANLYADLQESLEHEQATREKLIHSEKLAVAGRLLASVSHELNNPLQAIQNALYLLKDEKGLSVQGKQDLDIVLSEAERMATMLERLRTTYQRARAEDFRPVQLNNLIEDVFTLVATHLRHNQISFEFHSDPNLPLVPGLVDQLRQVILNLFLNAVDAMSGGGHLIVATTFIEDSREVLITISDNGNGIEPGMLSNIFDAFVTNKESGTGLGLTISYEIVDKHRGRIQAVNNPEGGATFSVWLPLESGGVE